MGKLGVRSVLSNLKLYLVSIALLIVTLGLLPILIIICTPILIYRKIASKVAPYLYPGVTKILTHGSTLFSIDDLHIHEENLIITTSTVEGNLPLETFRAIVLDRVLQLQLPNGAIRYPEFKQHFFDCLGFRFWKHCDNFDINDHVKLYNTKEGQIVTEEEINKIKDDLLNTPFKENTSPWLFQLVHNYIPDDPSLRMRTDQPISVIFMKVHHGLADGFSLQKVTYDGFIDLIDKNPLKTISNVPTRRKVNLLRLFWDLVSFPIRCIFEFARMAVSTVKKGPLHVPKNTQASGIYSAHPIINIQRIKRIKDELGASFTSVIFCVCAGAISKLMVQKKMKLPDMLPLVVPLPLPGHPDKLRNHMTYAAVYLPLSPKLNVLERLSTLNKSYDSLKRSTIPATVSLVSLLIGGMFTKLVGPLREGIMPPVIISSFPCRISYEWTIGGHRFLNLNFYCGLLNLFGLGVYIMTYGDDLKISMVGNSKIIASKDMLCLIDFVEQEMVLLEQEISPESVKVEK